jgi:transcription elongation factor Elf1
VSIPIDAPIPRAVVCPVCGKLLGATSKDDGVIVLYCKGCQEYRRIDLAEMPRSIQAGTKLWLLIYPDNR